MFSMFGIRSGTPKTTATPDSKAPVVPAPEEKDLVTINIIPTIAPAKTEDPVVITITSTTKSAPANPNLLAKIDTQTSNDRLSYDKRNAWLLARIALELAGTYIPPYIPQSDIPQLGTAECPSSVKNVAQKLEAQLKKYRPEETKQTTSNVATPPPSTPLPAPHVANNKYHPITTFLIRKITEKLNENEAFFSSDESKVFEFVGDLTHTPTSILEKESNQRLTAGREEFSRNVKTIFAEYQKKPEHEQKNLQHAFAATTLLMSPYTKEKVSSVDLIKSGIAMAKVTPSAILAQKITALSKTVAQRIDAMIAGSPPLTEDRKKALNLIKIAFQIRVGNARAQFDVEPNSKQFPHETARQLEELLRSSNPAPIATNSAKATSPSYSPIIMHLIRQAIMDTAELESFVSNNLEAKIILLAEMIETMEKREQAAIQEAKAKADAAKKVEADKKIAAAEQAKIKQTSSPTPITGAKNGTPTVITPASAAAVAPTAVTPLNFNSPGFTTRELPTTSPDTAITANPDQIASPAPAPASTLVTAAATSITDATGAAAIVALAAPTAAISQPAKSAPASTNTADSSNGTKAESPAPITKTNTPTPSAAPPTAIAIPSTPPFVEVETPTYRVNAHLHKKVAAALKAFSLTSEQKNALEIIQTALGFVDRYQERFREGENKQTFECEKSGYKDQAIETIARRLDQQLALLHKQLHSRKWTIMSAPAAASTQPTLPRDPITIDLINHFCFHLDLYNGSIGQNNDETLINNFLNQCFHKILPQQPATFSITSLIADSLPSAPLRAKVDGKIQSFETRWSFTKSLYQTLKGSGDDSQIREDVLRSIKLALPIIDAVNTDADEGKVIAASTKAKTDIHTNLNDQIKKWPRTTEERKPDIADVITTLIIDEVTNYAHLLKAHREATPTPTKDVKVGISENKSSTTAAPVSAVLSSSPPTADDYLETIIETLIKEVIGTFNPQPTATISGSKPLLPDVGGTTAPTKTTTPTAASKAPTTAATSTPDTSAKTAPKETTNTITLKTNPTTDPLPPVATATPNSVPPSATLTDTYPPAVVEAQRAPSEVVSTIARSPLNDPLGTQVKVLLQEAASLPSPDIQRINALLLIKVALPTIKRVITIYNTHSASNADTEAKNLPGIKTEAESLTRIIAIFSKDRRNVDLSKQIADGLIETICTQLFLMPSADFSTIPSGNINDFLNGLVTLLRPNMSEKLKKYEKRSASILSDDKHDSSDDTDSAGEEPRISGNPALTSAPGNPTAGAETSGGVPTGPTSSTPSRAATIGGTLAVVIADPMSPVRAAAIDVVVGDPNAPAARAVNTAIDSVAPGVVAPPITTTTQPTSLPNSGTASAPTSTERSAASSGAQTSELPSAKVATSSLSAVVAALAPAEVHTPSTSGIPIPNPSEEFVSRGDQVTVPSPDGTAPSMAPATITGAANTEASAKQKDSQKSDSVTASTGLPTSKPCPYSSRTMGLVREWCKNPMNKVNGREASSQWDSIDFPEHYAKTMQDAELNAAKTAAAIAAQHKFTIDSTPAPDSKGAAARRLARRRRPDTSSPSKASETAQSSPQQGSGNKRGTSSPPALARVGATPGASADGKQEKESSGSVAAPPTRESGGRAASPRLGMQERPVPVAATFEDVIKDGGHISGSAPLPVVPFSNIDPRLSVSAASSTRTSSKSDIERYKKFKPVIDQITNEIKRFTPTMFCGLFGCFDVNNKAGKARRLQVALDAALKTNPPFQYIDAFLNYKEDSNSPSLKDVLQERRHYVVDAFRCCKPDAQSWVNVDNAAETIRDAERSKTAENSVSRSSMSDSGSKPS